ncbi:MAG: glutamine-hydrolyzing GMP synthase [Anaerolineae bacterium]|nr:glutamine-hydrolyzing GMP synthase [Anaerolineae bacterium]
MGTTGESVSGREMIAVVDFGSQYSQLIARRVRECQVYSEIVPHDVTLEELQRLQPRGLILSGGPASVYEPDAPRLRPEIYQAGWPILGICYGMHLLGQQLGGRVAAASRREYGPARLQLAARDSPLFAGLDPELEVWMSHGDRVEELPPGFQVLARTENAPVAAMGDPRRSFYGLQFHPEVVHTPQGRQILQSFTGRICGCRGSWTPASFIAEAVAQLRRQIGKGKVICALSGGVDSAVTATLLDRAIGRQLTAVFVNNGLLRDGEAEETLQALRQHLGVTVEYVDATARFLAVLRGVTDPEEKRSRIGATFIEVFEEVAGGLGQVDFLAQGTLYPDVIESATSASKAAARIKTHHNVGGLPEGLRFRLVEPLRHLFKDEVRQVGLALGLPEAMVWRQPFPGPGLAVRVIGEVTAERLDVVRAADRIVREEVAAAGLGRDVWQYFAVLTPLRSVGVMGDHRTYADVVAVRSVVAEDAMTADWARLPYDLLARISHRIVNEVPGVNRVVYDISSKPPATIEWE